MHMNYQPTVDYGLPKIQVPGGYLMYAIFLPAIGLFLERYAYSAKIAMIHWALVLILMPISCALDKRMLEKHDVNTITLGKTYLFPPLYIFRRQDLVRKEAALCIACIILCVGAVFTNGFVKGLRINNDIMPDVVQNSSFSQLNNFSGSTLTTVGECLKAYSSEELKWNSEKTDYGFEVTAQGKHNNKCFSMVFVVEFDGFTYHDFYIDKILENDRELDKDSKTEVLDQCFIKYETDKKEGRSSGRSSSSETDSR